jgi:hypothetical protein
MSLMPTGSRENKKFGGSGAAIPSGEPKDKRGAELKTSARPGGASKWRGEETAGETAGETAAFRFRRSLQGGGGRRQRWLQRPRRAWQENPKNIVARLRIILWGGSAREAEFMRTETKASGRRRNGGASGRAVLRRETRAALQRRDESQTRQSGGRGKFWRLAEANGDEEARLNNLSRRLISYMRWKAAAVRARRGLGVHWADKRGGGRLWDASRLTAAFHLFIYTTLILVLPTFLFIKS